MNTIKLAVKCNSCGSWNAVTTNNLRKSVLLCKTCGNSKKIRCEKGWNLDTKVINENQDLSYIIQLLNMRDKT